MTIRQRILRLLYPLLMKVQKKKGGAQVASNHEKKRSMTSFYELEAQLNSNKELRFDSLKGKKVLLVNTASNCGYTGQYAELQKLYEANKERLEIIGFPANDFKEQEKGTDEEISRFCQVNFGVTFPLVKKSTVIKSGYQHPVFQWLSQEEKNGWNNQEPTWNFAKYLVNEEGQLTHLFEPAVSPLDEAVLSAITQKKD